jgi:hypothetical protein
MDENQMFNIANQADAETLCDYERAVPTKVCREIAGDHIGRPTSHPAVPSESSGKANFSEPRPIECPPGVAQLDKLMAQEDAEWRSPLARLLRQLGVGG